MSTSTSRMQLTKPDTGDSMASGATQLSANYDTIDSIAGAATFTSGTRPAGATTRWTGRVIFESDTNNYVYWNGSAWIYLGNKDKARQLVGNDSQLGAVTVSASTESLIKSYTFTATQNRRYRFTTFNFCEFVSNTNSTGEFRWRWAAGSSVTTAGTQFYSNSIRVNSTTNTGRSFMDSAELDYTAATQQITVGLFLNNGSATDSFGTGGSSDSIDVQDTFMVQDWGIH